MRAKLLLMMPVVIFFIGCGGTTPEPMSISKSDTSSSEIDKAYKKMGDETKKTDKLITDFDEWNKKSCEDLKDMGTNAEGCPK